MPGVCSRRPRLLPALLCVYYVCGQSPVASLRLFTTSSSVTVRPPRLGRRWQRLWWPASLRSRTASPNCQDTALRDLDFLLCIHFKVTHSERTKSEVSCWICPTWSWPSQWKKIKLYIFKNDGMQFRMVHLFDNLYMSTRGGLQTLIPGLKSVENRMFVLTTQSWNC